MHAPIVEQNVRWAYLCLATSMGLVGIYVALSKPLLAVFPVFVLAWLRFGIGAVAMWRWLKPAPGDPPITMHLALLLAAQSFFGNFLFSICMLFGVAITPAASAGVVLAATPAACALLAWLLLRERLSARVLIAVGLAVLGVALLSLSKSEHAPQQIQGQWPEILSNVGLEATSAQWLGPALLLGAVFCEAAFAVIGRRVGQSLSPKRATALVNAWGLALMTPLGLWASMGFQASEIHLSVWLGVVLYALAASVWTAWLWMTGLQCVTAAKAGVFAVCMPLGTALTAILVLGEALTWPQVGAFGIALLGLLIVTWPQGKDGSTVPPKTRL